MAVGPVWAAAGACRRGKIDTGLAGMAPVAGAGAVLAGAAAVALLSAVFVLYELPLDAGSRPRALVRTGGAAEGRSRGARGPRAGSCTACVRPGAGRSRGGLHVRPAAQPPPRGELEAPVPRGRGPEHAWAHRATPEDPAPALASKQDGQCSKNGGA